MKSSFYDNKDKLCPSNFKVVSLCAMSTSWTGAMLYRNHQTNAAVNSPPRLALWNAREMAPTIYSSKILY